MEQNHEHAKTNTYLAGAYNILKVDNEHLQLKIKKLQARLRDQEDSFKYRRLHCRRSCFAKYTFDKIPARPTASSFSSTWSESSKFEEEDEDDGEDKGKDIEPDVRATSIYKICKRDFPSFDLCW